jgi:hypothetical protein
MCLGECSHLIALIEIGRWRLGLFRLLRWRRGATVRSGVVGDRPLADHDSKQRRASDQAARDQSSHVTKVAIAD